MSLRGVAGYWMVAGFLLLAAVPFLPFRSAPIYGTQLIPVLCFVVLALGLNVVVGYTGLLHLGIAAFFGIGAYTAGILTVTAFPFGTSFVIVAAVAAGVAAAVGVATAAPTLRLRGDYLALVTLGFGLITIYVIRNLDGITDGTQGLKPVSPNLLPGIEDPVLPKSRPGWKDSWRKYPYLYFICLGLLAAVMVFLRNLERSRLGRAWVALREDELAASCMGLNPARLKLSAIALGAGLAGLAGCAVRRVAGRHRRAEGVRLQAVDDHAVLRHPRRSGKPAGRAARASFLLVGYDQILTPELDNWLQAQKLNPNGKEYLKVSGWRLFIFGLALILMMRFRPEGLLPSQRHEARTAPGSGRGRRRARGESRSGRGEVERPVSGASMAVLTIEKLTMRFGGITAVSGVDLVVEPGQIFSVIGPNGAGKTTVFNAVTGIYEPTEGEVLFDGQPLVRPFTWKVGLSAALIGLVAGLLLALFAVNVDTLWRRSIRGTEAAQREAVAEKVMAAAEEDSSVDSDELMKKFGKETPFSWSTAARAQAHVAERPVTGTVAMALGFAIGAAGTVVTWRRSRRAPDVITEGGIARTFQNIRLFQSMTVAGERPRRDDAIDPRAPARWRRSASAGSGDTKRKRNEARPSCSRSSASPGGTTNSPRTSPTATSAGSKSPARSPPSPSSCCSTNRPPG